MIALLLALASAEAGEGLHADVGGDIKTFFVAMFPYESLLLPDDPFAQGVAHGRLKLRVGWGDVLELDVHHAVSAIAGSAALVGLNTGVVFQPPEAVPLTWTLDDGGSLTMIGRTDRLVLRARLPHVDVAVGRQAISFGHGMFFTPLDLVNPFFPTTIDQEYKPGVDAARVDIYPSLTSRVTLVGAYAGGWDWPGAVLAGYGQVTVGLTDLGLLLGAIHGDAVAGATVSGGVGPVGLHGDATVTLPHGGGDPFVRAVAGAFWRPTGTTTLTGELYLQTLGASSPDGYLALATDDRWVRGELWLLGRGYVGLAVAQEITPLISASLASFVNVEDPSAFVAPSLSWSVAGNAAVGLGAFVGFGRRPDGLALRSEFGLYPASAFLDVRTYF